MGDREAELLLAEFGEYLLRSRLTDGKLAYLGETGATVEGRPMVGVNHYRDFISQLATRQHVAAGTQNQAFGALLFLCREILGVEVGDLGRTVRARRGERLPTVLSPD